MMPVVKQLCLSVCLSVCHTIKQNEQLQLHLKKYLGPTQPHIQWYQRLFPWG